MRRTALLVGLASLALALAAASCGGGGGGDRLTKEELIAQGDAICKKHRDKFEAIDFPKTDPTSPETSDEVLEQFGGALDQGVTIFRDQIGELRDLNPPEDFEEAYDGAMDGLDGAVDSLDEAAGAAHDADRDKLREALDESNRRGEAADKVARDYGFQVCGAES
ncbi:MAG: hypothetical protein H0V84_06915 [Actinobacteria bacterium]|nr:hypothetical protein [Actinomycetota bacterium]